MSNICYSPLGRLVDWSTLFPLSLSPHRRLRRWGPASAGRPGADGRRAEDSGQQAGRPEHLQRADRQARRRPPALAQRTGGPAGGHRRHGPAEGRQRTRHPVPHHVQRRHQRESGVRINMSLVLGWTWVWCWGQHESGVRMNMSLGLGDSN